MLSERIARVQRGVTSSQGEGPLYARIAALYRRYLDLSMRRPWATLLVLAIVAGGLFWVGSGLSVRGDLEDLFPEDTPAVVHARETRRVLGNTQELRVLIGSADREVNRKVAERVAAFLEARTDEIARVEWRREIAFFEKNGLLFVSMEDLEELHEEVSEAIKKEVKKDLGLDDFALDEPEPAPQGDDKKEETRLPSAEEVKKKHKVEGFNEYFESPDGEVIAVKAYPTFKPSDATRTRALNDALEAELARIQGEYPDAGLSFTTDGDFSQVTRAAKQIMSDAAESGIWSLLGIAVVVIIFFRRVRALIVVMGVLGVATACMLAFAEIAVGYLNLVTSIIFAILFGMGVDFIIHGMSRVDEEYHGDVPLERAVRDGMFGLARPVFNAMLTTAVTFWALIVFDFRGFSQLGLIAGFGVAFALLALYLLYPPMAVGFHRIWRQKPSRRRISHPEASSHAAEVPAGAKAGLATAPPVSRATKRLAWLIVAFVVALGGAGAVIAGDLTFDSDMGKFRVKDSAAENELKTKYKEAETRTASPALVVTHDLAETERLHRWLDAHLDAYPALTEVSSVWSFVPSKQAEKLAIIKEIKRKIDNKYGAFEGQTKADADELMKYLSPSLFGPEDLPDWVRQRFTDADGRFGRYVLLFTRGSKADALVALEIQRQLGTITLPAEGGAPAATFTASATYFISGEAYAVVKREGPFAALIGLIVTIFVVLFDFRSPRQLLMILTPILSSFAITLGLMTLVDLRLDLFNVVVLPQIFGIGIDTGTHLTHRIKEGGPRVVFNVRATAIAAGISSLLTIIGFAALLPVDNQGLRSIGLVAVLGIGCAYLVNVLMFTAFQWISRPTRVV